MKQAAGDLAKQKGVQWGVRDKEIAKWVGKFAGLMRWINVDIGGQVHLPITINHTISHPPKEEKISL